jgi:hypothetical protein
MRIPPSVIVMSIVVAVPFGLAIKDTVKHDDPQSRAEREAKREADEFEAEQRVHEAEEAKALAEKTKQQKARHDELAGLFGQTPASLGPTLGGITLGDNPDATVLSRLESSALPIRLERDPSDHIMAVTIALGTNYGEDDSADDCNTVKDHLTSLWGHDENYTWHDAPQRQRVSIHGSDCVVRIELYFEANDWLKHIPMNLVGKTVAQAIAQPMLAAPTDLPTDSPDSSDQSVSWRLPGLGRGNQPTTLQAVVSGKRIVATVATTVLAAEDGDAFIAAATAALHGKPHHEDGETTYTWKRTPQVTIELDGTAMTMTIGKLPMEPAVNSALDGDL